MAPHAAINDVDRRVIEALPGSEKVKALLADGGLNITEFTRRHGLKYEQVSMCIRGVRPYPKIRETLAVELRLTCDEIDLLIDGDHREA